MCGVDHRGPKNQGKLGGRLRISVLAWGSIVWARRNLAIITDFEPTGPRLPIEFCRVSRDGRLTLVFEEVFGAPCIAYSATSGFDNLDAAIENLRDREHMPSPEGIGFTIPDRGRQSARAVECHPRAVKVITAWANSKGFDAAIWTALGSNFAEKAREPFSAEAAIRYLETRNGKTLDAALTYIQRAPPEIQTPVRVAVNTRWPEAFQSSLTGLKPGQVRFGIRG